MQLAWSHKLSSTPVSLSLAREKGTFLLRDSDHLLTLHNASGECENRHRASSSLAAALLSEDGRFIVTAGKRGILSLLTNDFIPIWEHNLSSRPIGLAIDPLGYRVAVTEESGSLNVYDRAGKIVFQFQTPRPLMHLCFIPELPILVGSCDFGLVCAVDAQGKSLWRDGLVAHVGGMASSGDGKIVLLACYSEGLCCYSALAATHTRLASPTPSRLLAMSYTGEIIATAGMNKQLSKRDATGEVKEEFTLAGNPLSLAMDPLGQFVLVLLPDQIVRIEMKGG